MLKWGMRYMSGANLNGYYDEANAKRGVIYEDNSEEQCLSGVCGI